MKMALTCSVAMATYNGAQFIEKQLQSLLEQTRPIDKVYIFDDRSTDNTAELIEKFIANNGLSNWHFQIQTKNVGCRENFKSAITACDTDVIFLCDQDDIWLNNKIEVMLDIFQRRPEVKSLICGFKLIDQKDNIIIKKTQNDNLWFHDFDNPMPDEPSLYKSNLVSVLNHNIGPGCAQAFRRELVNEYLCFDYKPFYHDYKITMIAAFANGLYVLNEALIHYRRHGNNAVGAPRFYITRKNTPILVPLYYLFICANTLRSLISKGYKRLAYDMSSLIVFLDKLPIDENLRSVYENWKEFAAIRAQLYSNEKKKKKYLKLQKSKYLKFYKSLNYSNDPIESFEITTKDILALLKHN